MGKKTKKAKKIKKHEVKGHGPEMSYVTGEKSKSKSSEDCVSPKKTASTSTDDNHTDDEQKETAGEGKETK